jgi:hypothetical protein
MGEHIESGLPEHIMAHIANMSDRPDSLTVVYEDVSIRKNLKTDSSWGKVDDPWGVEEGALFGPGSVKRAMRVLVFTPAHPKYGIMPQTTESVQKAMQEYDGVAEWFISYNDNPYAEPYENVTHQHNKAREIMLDLGYDALFSVEADMIIPPDTIQSLIDVDADIAYGLYVWRHKIRRWNAYKTLTLWGGESFSYNHDGSDAREAWGKVMDVVGLGMGCTLIRRNVMEKLHFRVHDGKPGWIADEYKEQFEELGVNPYRARTNMVCDDWLLAMDAQHYNFKQRCNLNVICGHIDGDTVIWPDVEETKFYRIEEI